MATEMKKLFHTVRNIPCQQETIFDSTFSSILSWLSYKSYTQISFTERTLVLSHCNDIEVDCIQSQNTLHKFCIIINLDA